MKENIYSVENQERKVTINLCSDHVERSSKLLPMNCSLTANLKILLQF